MMPLPHLEIDLNKIHHNARSLVKRLAQQGVSVTGVTKATLGSSEIANSFLQAGVAGLGDSRIENIEAMRLQRTPAELTLIRSPMLSQAERVVIHADVSFNTEMEVIRQLSREAQKIGRAHGVVLMVELGDLRDGIMPEDIVRTVRETLSLPYIEFKGIGTNLACRCGVSPDARNMAELSALADLIETTFDLDLEIVSGGNSANLEWVLSTTDTGRVNNLRLGEAILLGCETLHRQPINDLFTDAFSLVAEVIESKTKPSQPNGSIAQAAFGEAVELIDRGVVEQSILAIGHQDTDPHGLLSSAGIEIVGASSDHLVLVSDTCKLSVGSKVSFSLNYSALVRAMTSPYVTKCFSNAKVWQ